MVDWDRHRHKHNKKKGGIFKYQNPVCIYAHKALFYMLITQGNFKNQRLIF